jgi:hypothetical protein
MSNNEKLEAELQSLWAQLADVDAQRKQLDEIRKQILRDIDEYEEIADYNRRHVGNEITPRS